MGHWRGAVATRTTRSGMVASLLTMLERILQKNEDRKESSNILVVLATKRYERKGCL
jgi:hypothetical protein